MELKKAIRFQSQMISDAISKKLLTILSQISVIPLIHPNCSYVTHTIHHNSSYTTHTYFIVAIIPHTHTHTYTLLQLYPSNPTHPKSYKTPQLQLYHTPPLPQPLITGCRFSKQSQGSLPLTPRRLNSTI